MSEIQSISSPVHIQYIIGAVGFLVSCISVLIAFIVRGFKRDHDEMKKTIKAHRKDQLADHDRIDKLEIRYEMNSKP